LFLPFSREGHFEGVICFIDRLEFDCVGLELLQKAVEVLEVVESVDSLVHLAPCEHINEGGIWGDGDFLSVAQEELLEVFLPDLAKLDVELHGDVEDEEQFVFVKNGPAHLRLEFAQEFVPDVLDPHFRNLVFITLLSRTFEHGLLPVEGLLLHEVYQAQVGQCELHDSRLSREFHLLVPFGLDEFLAFACSLPLLLDLIGLLLGGVQFVDETVFV